MNISEIKDLALTIAKNRSVKGPIDFSAGEVTLSLDSAAMNTVLRDELKELTKTPNDFEKNKHVVFSIIQESVDVRLPRELSRWMNGFAKVTSYGINDKPEVTLRKPNKNLRGRSFVTLGTPAGVYEVFRLAQDGKVVFNMTAATGAIQIAYEDFLTGRIDWNELVDILMLGVEDRIYEQIGAAFVKMNSELPAANKASTSAFEADKMSDLIGLVEAYGAKATIVCTPRFARLITDGADWASEIEKVARRDRGYMGHYKNANIVVIENTFIDETNAVKALDDSIAYIIPAGGEPLFHVALQGGLQVRSVDNSDWSKELHAYQKFGVGAVSHSGIASYEITSLK